MNAPSAYKQEQLNDGDHASLSRGKSVGTSIVTEKVVLQMRNKKMFDLENEGQRDGAQFRNGEIWLQISKSVKDIKHFYASFLHF